MGPIETLQDITGAHYKQLKREGLNPFDLLSWDALVNLWTMVKCSGERGDFRDRKLAILTKQMVWSALERKAEAIDIQNQDDNCDQILQNLRHE